MVRTFDYHFPTEYKYFILARENMDFNDEYWTENYISILKDGYEEFYPFFRTWLKDKKSEE